MLFSLEACASLPRNALTYGCSLLPLAAVYIPSTFSSRCLKLEKDPSESDGLLLTLGII